MKLTSEGWTSAGYLLNSRGPFRGIFQGVAATGWLLDFTDSLVSWGLTLVGLFLILGLCWKWAAAGAAVFLAVVYLANPPWPGVNTIPGEGSFLIVDKNLVELGATLMLFYFGGTRVAGLDYLIVPWVERSEKGADPDGR